MDQIKPPKIFHERPGSTIKEGRDWYNIVVYEGCSCPICKRFCKKYGRRLNGGMACALTKVYATKKHDWVHFENFAKNSDLPQPFRGDFTKLRWWGLIEKMIGRREDGSSRVGYWRVTKKGADFVKNKFALWDKLIENYGEIEGIAEDAEFKFITQVMNDDWGEKTRNKYGWGFSYVEIMQPIPTQRSLF